VHAFIVVGLSTPRFPTSAEYMHLDFTGRAIRLWTVPLFYKLLPNDPLRIAGQVVLAAVSWWVLASVASSMMRDRRVQTGIQLVILALGVAGPIAGWNSAILSESATISLTALLVAAWLRYVQRPGTATASWAIIATIAWTFTRQDHVVIGALITAVVLVSAARKRSALQLSLAAALVVVSAFGFVTASRSKELTRFNLAAIVAWRVLPNPSYTSWFIDHGMPDTPAIQSFSGAFVPERLGDDADFGPWATAKGERTYVEFLISHPRYTLLDPLPYFSGEEPSLVKLAPPRDALSPNPTPSFLSPTADWGRHREVLPRVVQDLLFEQGQIGDVLLLGGVAIALAVVAWGRHGWDRRLLVPVVVLATVVPHVFVVWLGSATELDRHALIIAVSLRIALWLIAACAVDALLLATPTSSRTTAAAAR
jgi:hypothetical protein